MKDKDEPVPKYLRGAMKTALQAIHDHGATHGDIRHCNFMRMGDTVQMINLAETVLRATRANRDVEMQSLEKMLIPLFF